MTRADQLREAVGRCEARLKIAHDNLQQCDPENQRTLEKIRSDWWRARDDLDFMRNRLGEAMVGGSRAYKRGLAL